ncbi:MAG: MarR family winged helix-turn-helix transcriptional regulator [Acidimicrobiales bacterium]
MTDGLSDTDIELFGSVLVFTQQLMLRADEYLEPFGLTSRQWLLLAVLDKRFPGSAPSISEATAVFGTSRQNVKQVALQLERRGWLRVEPDPVDRRMLRLVLTDKRTVFDDPAVQADQAAFILSVFGGLTPGERRTLLDMVATCIAGLSSTSNDQPKSREDRP